MGLSYGIHDFIEGGVITAVILLNIVVGYDNHFEFGVGRTLVNLFQILAGLQSRKDAPVPQESHSARVKRAAQWKA